MGHLLHLSHGMWMARNSIVHARAANGLKLKEKETLEKEIKEQHKLGTKGLASLDKHHMDWSLEGLLGSSVEVQQAWLRGIKIARQTGVSREQEEDFHLRSAMAHWLSRAPAVTQNNCPL